MFKPRLKPASKPAIDDDFFLPELCESEALFALILLAELLVLVLVLAEPMLPNFDWVRLALTSLFVQWIVLLSAACMCRLRPLLAQLRPWLAGCLCSALVVVLTLACTLVADYYDLGGQLPRSGEVNLYLRHALIALIMSALLLRYFYLQSQWRRQEQAELRARIESLQARIRPHFLFNTLNSAIALVRAEPAQAEALLEDLSDLFRHALVEQGETATLGEEIQLAQRYLAIEQVRFGERLRVQWLLDPNADGAHLPPLLLQPLVENAVKHGVEPSRHGGKLRIATQRRGDRVVVRITNTLPAPHEGSTSTRGHGIALDNVRARLALLHDVQAQFSTKVKNGLYQVRISIPCG